MTLKLTPIQHLIKEFLYSIVQLNVDALEYVVLGVSMIIMENHTAKILCLSQTRITNLPTMHFTEVANLCIQMLPLNAFVQKEGLRISQLKGKYVAQFLVLIQVIWLMGICGTYVSKKLMLLVALTELQKLVN
jgi:hypothetical protein